MIFSRKALSALLLLSAAAVAQAQVIVNGFVSVQGGLVRQTSNANVALNAQFQRTATAELSGNEVVYVNQIVNVSTSGAGGLGGLIPNVQITKAVVRVSTSPFPTVLVTKMTTSLAGISIGFTANAHAATFPLAIEYNEVNGQDGFQAGADTVAQNFSLAENLKQWIFGATPTNWQPLTVTTEMWPVNATSTVNATVQVAKSCNNVNGFCFQFRFSNSMYVRNGITYLPDAVKVDVLANTANFKSNNGMLAMLSSMLSTVDSLNVTDLHTAVDNTVAQAKAVGGTAVCSADFVTQFNGSTQSAYLNFARTATLTSAANGNSTINVNAQVIASATAMAKVNAMINVSYANQANQLNANFASMTNVQAIVYSFLAANNGAKSITWDPEVGIATVNTSNSVVGGTTGLSAGAIAGIVIAVLAVAGVAGFFGYRAIRNKKGTALLG